MKTMIEMPSVDECDAVDCAYNVHRKCHARAITVGDTIHPDCDTFMRSRDAHTRRPATAGVGACKVALCRHNEDFECHASSIRVGQRGKQVGCLTYDPS